MKISKVRENKGKLTINAKTAIVSEKNVQEGILYTDPSRQGIGRKSAEDRDRYIDDRIRRSKVLYTIFNEEKSSGKKDEDAAALKMISSIWKKAVNLSRMLKENDAVFEAYAEKSLANRRSHIEQSPAFTELPIRCNVQKAAELQNIICKENLLSRMKSEISSYRTPAEITEHNIDDIINRRLKKSLCRESAKKGLKALLMEAFCRDHQVPADVDIQRDFIDLMLEDYYRVRVKGQVARSIKNKNMPVQPTAGNENVHFAIPVAEKNTKAGKTKKEEQEAFNAFLSSYADLNTENRNQQLLRLRRLVNLYFYGAGETTDPDVWEDHARHRAIKEAFIDAPKEVKTENPSEKRRAEKEREEKIRELFRNKNIACYRAAIAEAEKDNNGRCFENLIPEKDQPGVPFSEKDHSGRFFEDGMLNRFFIHRMESALERIYTHYKNGQEYKLQTGYLSEKIWKDMLNYLSVKYIAIGKAVYNYAMDETADKSEVIEPGKINEAYVSGISSFDYELIKAEEMLQRETAVYVAFAARHLAHQTVDLDEKNSDFLLLKEKGKMKDGQPAEDNIIRFVKKDIDLKRVILQFFGGRSHWQDFPFDRYMADGKDDTDLLYVLKSVIYSMRNDSFHYATENHDEGSWNKVIRDLVSSMFASEAERISAVQKVKFYTNNLPMFYSQKDLKQTLTGLYREHV